MFHQYGYDDYKDGWVNLNPMKTYYADDKNGADDKILFADIPLYSDKHCVLCAPCMRESGEPLKNF